MMKPAAVPRKVPYAIANFEELIEDGYYFVDKTSFLRNLEQYKAPVFLRPRRFGKSLWCSLLECYYDVNRKGKFATLFGDTDIGANPTPHHNSCCVLRLDCSKILVKDSYHQLEDSFNAQSTISFQKFVAAYATMLGPGLSNLPSDATTALSQIVGYCQDQGLPPVMVIIDEYDNFTNQLLTGHLDSLYKEVTTGDSFLRSFYKVMKAGIGEGSIARVFITGVLPITMDDLTSGFNIAEIITLVPDTLNMMGFTQQEVDNYVDNIFAEHALPPSLREIVGQTLLTHYNGYRLLPQATETLYNSTILNYYLKLFVISKGRLPDELIDENLRIDIKWIERLAGNREYALQTMSQLLTEGTLFANISQLRSKFGSHQFFDAEFLPMSLYYLGMLTFQDRFSFTFPNLTVKTIFVEYYNRLSAIKANHDLYAPFFQQFIKDRRFEGLFAGYWKQYLGQIPAQAFDKINENFIRTTFYELCRRYLDTDLIFSIEVNHPSGRSDFEAIGRPDSDFAQEYLVVEFKHFAKAEGERLEVLRKNAPEPPDVDQIRAYEADIHQKFPSYSIQKAIVYTVGNSGWKWFSVS